MASAVKIKRGDGAPVAGADGSNGVWPYELAWDYTNNKLYINDNGTMREVGGSSYSAGTNISLSGTTFNVDDAFLKNDANDTTSGTITAAGFTTTGNLSLAGHAVNDIDIGSEFVDTDDHLMTSGAIKEKIEAYGYSANAIENSGTWNGAGFGGSRYKGLTINSGELSIQRDHPNNGQVSLLVDGGYSAGENNGFWSLYDGNDWGNRVGFYSNGSGVGIFNTTHASGDWNFQVNGSSKMYIDGSASQIGINSTSPDSTLDITASGVHGLVINQDGSNADISSRLLFKEQNSTIALYNTGDTFSFRTGATIGSTSGTQRFYVNTSGASVVGDLGVSGNTVLQYGLAVNEGGHNADFRAEGDTEPNLFKVDASADKVGINQGSPSFKLDINGDLRVVGNGDHMIRFTRSGADVVSIEQDSSQLYFYNRTTSKVMFLMSETGSAKMGYNTNPIFELRNTGTSAGNGGSLTFGHNQDSSTTAMARISGYLVDGSSGGRAGHLRFWTSRAGSDELAMQLQNDNKLRLYQPGDTSDYGEMYVDDDRVHFHAASGNYHRFTTDHGYIELGPANDGWGHINTDRGKFYFNYGITVDSGIVTSYDEDLSLRRTTSTANRIDISDGYSRIICANGEKFRVSSDGRVNYNGWTGVDHITVRSNGHTNSSNAATFYIKFCTVVVDNSPTNYNGLNLSGTILNGDNNHGNSIDWSVWFNAALDSAQIAHGGYMMSKGAHWISNIFVQRTGGDGEIDNGTCTYELYYDLNQGWVNNFYNVATEVHYPSEGKFNVTWNHDQSEVTSLPGTEVVNMQTNYYDDGNQTLVQSGAVGSPSYSFLASRNTGMYRGAADTIDFTNGGTRMLTIQADGDLELRSDGSSQGAYIQRVGGVQFTWDRDSYGTANEHSIRSDSDNIIISSYDDVTINLDSNNNDGAETFDIRRHATSLTGGELLFQIGGSGTSYTMGASQVGNGSAGAPTLSFYNDTDTGMYRKAANQIGFSTAGEEQMYLADGTLLITQPVKIQFANDQRIFDNGSGGLKIGAASHELQFYAGGSDPMQFYTGGISGTERIRLESGGDCHFDQDVIAFSTTPSDKKLKTNIKEINYGLETVMKLNPKEYDWKKDDRHDIGFIAQEVEEVIPEIVKDKKHFDENIKTLDYEKLTAVLIKAVQEQQQQINELKEKLNG